MKIEKILTQNRRDFTAYFKCEHCDHTPILKGYDDSYFHNEVIPKMICERCGKQSPEDYRPLTTKYRDGEQI